MADRKQTIARYLKDFKVGESPTMTAAEELGKMKAKEAVPEIIKFLDHNDNMIKAYAAQALGDIGDARAVKPLVACFKYWNEGFSLMWPGGEESKGVIDYVTDALVKIKSKTVLTECLLPLQSSEEHIRFAADRVLSGRNDLYIVAPQLFKLLEHKDDKVQSLALRLLESVDLAKTRTLWQKGVLHTKANVRLYAVRTLSRDKKSVPVLKKVYAKEKNKDVKSVLEAVLSPEKGSKGLSPNIVDELFPGSWPNSQKLKKQLEDLGENAVPALILALRSSKVSARIEAARYLGERKAKKAVPQLIKALHDREDEVREYAARALGLIKAKEAVPALKTLVEYSSSHTLSAAMGALKVIDFQKKEEYLNSLIDLPKTRRSASRALAYVGSDKAVKMLVKRLVLSNGMLDFSYAIELLLRDHPDKIMTVLKEAKSVDNKMTIGKNEGEKGLSLYWEVTSEVWNGIVYAIAKTGDAGREYVLKSLKHKDPAYRKLAIDVLSKMKDKDDVSYYIAALKDSDEGVRLVAAGAVYDMDLKGNADIVKALFDAAEKGKGSIWFDCVHALRKFATNDQIFNELESKKEKRVYIAVKLLGRSWSNEAVDKLIKMFPKSSVKIKNSICFSLGQMKGEKAYSFLIKQLNVADKGVLGDVVYALGMVKNKKAIPILTKLLKKEKDVVLKRKLQNAIDDLKK